MAQPTRTEVDGVPVFWSEAPDPLVGALLFRVGRADETLPTGGLTHLVEHLALFPIGRQVYDYNGRVDHNTAMFYASGSQAEVVGFLSEVAANLGQLPMERLEGEKRVLRVEANNSGDLYAQLLSYRYGAVGQGLPAFNELGLRWLAGEDVLTWAAEHFTRGNAVAWLTGPPDGLSFPLADGERKPVANPKTLERLTLPAQSWHNESAIALTFEGQRSSALNAGFGIASERAHTELRLVSGVTYSPTAVYDHLTNERAHLMLAADCQDKDAKAVAQQLVKIYDDLASGNVTENELDWDRTVVTRSLDDPRAMPARLDRAARDELLQEPSLSDAQLKAERNALTPDAVAMALAEVGATALVSVPRGAPMLDPQRFTHYEVDPVDPLIGARYPPRADLKGFEVFNELVVAGEGVTYRVEADAPPTTIMFDECVAAVEGHLGSLTIVSLTGTGLTLSPDSYEDGKEALEAVRRRLPDSVGVALDPFSQALDSLAHEKLAARRKVPIAGELGMLAELLATDEQLVNLAEARREKFSGLLAITDSRLLFLFRGSKEDDIFEAPLDTITKVDVKGLRGKRLVVQAEKQAEFSEILPSARLDEIRHQLDGECRS